MRDLTSNEILQVDGGRKFFNVFSGIVWGATFGAITGIFVAGPAGMIGGAITGAVNGAAMSIAKEGADGLVEIANGGTGL